MPKRPYIDFFVDDWLADEKLRLCSLEARGLWMDILCLCHKSDRRGFLQQANGQPFSHEQIARFAGCSPEKVRLLVQELLDSGTASVKDELLYCRRMKREEEKSRSCSESGKKGGRPKKSDFKSESKAVPGNGNGNGIGNGFGIGKEEGVGETIGENTSIADPFSPEALAQKWCFRCARRKFGQSADNEFDVAVQFRAWLEAGLSPEKLAAAIDAKRDVSEFVWQLKERVMPYQKSTNGRKEVTAADIEAAMKRRKSEEAKRGS